MTKFVPNTLLEFLTERITFCEAWIKEREKLELPIDSDHFRGSSNGFKKTLAELIIAKNWILGGDSFNQKKGMFIAKRLLSECLYIQEITLYGSSTLTYDATNHLRDLIIAFKNILASN